MIKKFLFMISLIWLFQCSAPPTALLGPVLTGAKTGSIYQTSLSFGSNKIIDKLREDKNFESDPKARLNWLYSKTPYYDQGYLKYPILMQYKPKQREVEK